MRSFLAVDISIEVMKGLEYLIEKFRKLDSNIRWVKAHNIHITLNFFGEIDKEQSFILKQIIEDTSCQFNPFTVQIEGLGAFPSIGKPRVIWCGVVDQSQSLVGINRMIREGIMKNSLSVHLEDREFIPHLTLGRIKRKCSDKIIAYVKRDSKKEFGRFKVDYMTLYKSILTRNGPIYEPVQRFDIGTKE